VRPTARRGAEGVLAYGVLGSILYFNVEPAEAANTPSAPRRATLFQSRLEGLGAYERNRERCGCGCGS